MAVIFFINNKIFFRNNLNIDEVVTYERIILSVLLRNISIAKYLDYSQNALIPAEHREDVVGHIVLVHQSVGLYSKLFLQRLRRSNFVTPKNYLDFINTYLKLLKDKDQFILSQVRFLRQIRYFHLIIYSLNLVLNKSI